MSASSSSSLNELVVEKARKSSPVITKVKKKRASTVDQGDAPGRKLKRSSSRKKRASVSLPVEAITTPPPKSPTMSSGEGTDGSDGAIKLKQKKRSNSKSVSVVPQKTSMSTSGESSSHSGTKRKGRKIRSNADRRKSLQERIFKQEKKQVFNAALDISGLLSPHKRAMAEIGSSSEQELKAAVDADPDDHIARVRYGDYLMYMAHDADGAEQQYLRAIAAKGKYAPALLRYAEMLWGLRRQQDVACEYFQKAAAAGKKDADLLNRCGLFHELAEMNIPRAGELYKKAANCGGDLLGTSYGNLARVSKAQKKHDDAEKLYKKAIKINPNNALLHSNYGWFLESCRDDIDKAEKAYLTAIGHDDQLGQALFNYARLMDLKRQNHKVAREYYEKTVAAQPDHSNAHLGLAMILFSQHQDVDGAEKHFKQATEADRTNAIACFNYAAFLEQVKKDDEGALQYYFQATCIRPNNDTFNQAYLSCLQRREGTGSADDADEEV